MDKQRVVIAGAGVMGASIAQVYAGCGWKVVLYDIAPAFLEKGRELLTLNQQNLVKEEMISQSASDALRESISYSCGKESFRDAGLVVESIVEKLEVKHSFWEEVSRLAPEQALLVTNTSGLRISEIASAVHRPERFAGQHWLNPPHLIPLCEIVRGEATSRETVDALVRLAKELGKKPVVVEDINGFIINRLQFSILREALHIVESGAATFEDVDNVMKYGLGMRYACLGPFDTADIGGLDTFDNISSYLFADLSDAKERSGTLRELVEAGRLGVKSGRGFYDYADGKDKETIRRRDEMFIKLAKCLYSD